MNKTRITPTVQPSLGKLSKEDEQKLIEEFKKNFHSEENKNLRGSAQPLFEQFEPWKFYTYKESSTPGALRVMGIDYWEEQDKHFLRIYKACDGGIDEILQVPPENIVEIENWTQAHIDVINKCGCPDAFLQRLGFTYFMKLKGLSREKKLNKK